MNFAYSDDQLAWRETVRSVLRRHAPIAASRELYEKGEGWSAETWRRLEAIGAHGIHAREELEELAIVVEEAGAVLLRAPYTTNAVAAAAGVAPGPEVTAAVLEPGPRVRDGRVEGVAAAVPFGAHVDSFLVATDSAIALVREGVTRRERPSFDLTTPVADVSFEAAPAQILATGPDAARILAEARLLSTVLAAAGMVGGTQACLDGAVAFAKDRHQFGRPIGGFQAVKHLCAEAFVELELARSATMYAVWALRTGSDERHRAASIAKALASEAYTLVADTALHVHGGMGFTWEHDSHLHVRRAAVAAATDGTVAQHREIFLAASAHPNQGES
jgi:alkylation response protein AidB-like acyl-CoA dehydrogenase